MEWLFIQFALESGEGVAWTWVGARTNVTVEIIEHAVHAGTDLVSCQGQQ